MYEWMTDEDWIKVYQDKGALWIHSGNDADPHALLTSGNHSNGFFNSRLISADEELLRQAARALVARYLELEKRYDHTHLVVGPQTGATKLAHELAVDLDFRNGDCTSLSPAKAEVDGKKSMVFTDEERQQLAGKNVLICEDVITTGGSVEQTVQAVEAASGKVLPYIVTLVNRSGRKTIGGRPIIALITRLLPIWAPQECPLCKTGSIAVRPKDNWALLTGCAA